MSCNITQVMEPKPADSPFKYFLETVNDFRIDPGTDQTGYLFESGFIAWGRPQLDFEESRGKNAVWVTRRLDGKDLTVCILPATVEDDRVLLDKLRLISPVNTEKFPGWMYFGEVPGTILLAEAIVPEVKAHPDKI